jgi:hypothetical protein
MTKSGIGTTSPIPQQQQSNTNTMNSLVSISNAEIPIWVSDKKKWVTGISKKTTINDLIFAILKQCQLVNSNNEMELVSNQYVLIEYKFTDD